MSDGIGLDAASERLADRFTRPMRAATSGRGVLTDPPVVCAAIAVIVLASVILYNRDVLNRAQMPFVYVAIATPIAAAVAIHLSLGSARKSVVTWLAGLPFPVDNVNGLLNGVGQHLVVRFAADGTGADLPTRQELSDLLEAVHSDCFALEFHPDEPEVELVVAVPESKMVPAIATHRRFRRARQMIDGCLVPLSAKHAIVWVRVA